MTRVDTSRAEIKRLIKATPFRPFIMNMENGDRIAIEHPENIAFDPGSANGKSGSDDFYVISSQLRVFSSFGAVTSIAMLDHAEV
jgi:hypothetical protein